jgi:hypothetical protein
MPKETGGVKLLLRSVLNRLIIVWGEVLAGLDKRDFGLGPRPMPGELDQTRMRPTEGGPNPATKTQDESKSGQKP